MVLFHCYFDLAGANMAVNKLSGLKILVSTSLVASNGERMHDKRTLEVWQSSKRFSQPNYCTVVISLSSCLNEPSNKFKSYI